MGRGAWWTTAHRDANSWTRLRNYHFHFTSLQALYTRKPFNYWPVGAFPGAWEISCDHNQIVLMSHCLDVFSFVCRKLNFYSTHITYILQLHTDDNYIMYIVFLFIHSIDRIWLIVVWERPFLFSLIPTCTSEMRVEAKRITDGIHHRISGWLRSSNGCLYFPPHDSDAYRPMENQVSWIVLAQSILFVA